MSGVKNARRMTLAERVCWIDALIYDRSERNKCSNIKKYEFSGK